METCLKGQLLLGPAAFFAECPDILTDEFLDFHDPDERLVYPINLQPMSHTLLRSVRYSGVSALKREAGDEMKKAEAKPIQANLPVGIMVVSAAVASVVYIGSMMFSGFKGSNELVACTVENFGTDAYIMAQFEVKDRLNDPGSARFNLRPDQISVAPETCVFSIRSEFSAKNGFGGRVRSMFVARMMRHEDESWSTLYLDVQ